MREKLEDAANDGGLVRLEIGGALSRANGQGEESGDVVGGFRGGDSVVSRGNLHGVDADRGRDLGGFLGGADLAGFQRGERSLEGHDFSGQAVDRGGQFAQADVLGGNVNLGGVELIGGADRQLLNGGTEVVTLDGEGDGGGKGLVQLFFDGQLVLRRAAT